MTTIARWIGLSMVFFGMTPPATAFPPYRSTDAGTADLWTLEARVGLIRLKHDTGQDQYASPLLRINLGLPHRTELVSEFEYLPSAGRIGDAALGFKWIPFPGRVRLGMETLALLPVSGESEVGVESSLLVTHRTGEVFLAHVNLAGFHDTRPSPAVRGWKAGAIGEFRLGRLRPGAEVFAKRASDDAVQLLAGPGLIVRVGSLDVRSGVHFGLTAAAADVTASLWVTAALALARR